MDVILQACENHRDRIAFSCMGQSLSYSRLDQLSGCFAAYLQTRTKLVAGDRIAIQLPNILQYPVAALGALRAGLVIVNTNPVYTATELKHQLNDSGAKAIVVLANTAAAAAEILTETGVENVIETELGDCHGWLKGRVINFLVRHVKKLVPPHRFKKVTGFRAALRLGKKALHRIQKTDIENASRHLAVLQYTGGTTGVAKGAMLTHGNLVANMYQLKERLQHDCPAPGGVMVAPLPFYHIYAFNVHLLYALHKGLHNLLIPNPRDIPGFVKTLKKYQMQGFVGINTLYNALCGSSEFAKLDFSRLQLSSAGGMALSAKTFKRWEELTGVRILEGYGLTETSPIVAANCSAMLQAGTIGKPLIETQVRVIDENGVELAAGEPGELCVRGPQVMSGYWQNPEETQQTLDAEGWLRTGDIAVIQPDGFIRIVDRIKDLIIVSGFNVFPAEIEEFVCKHPLIREAAAIGIRSGDIGERIKLFVVAESDELNREDVIRYCREGLAPYKVPRQVEFCDSLPKSNVGKVMRRKLREPD